MKVWREALERIAACNGGEGYMPELAKKALLHQPKARTRRVVMPRQGTENTGEKT